MKKFSLLLLVVLSSVMLFTGCGKENQSQKGKEPATGQETDNETVQREEPITDNKYNYFVVNLFGKQVPVVSFYHPQIRGDHDKFMKRYDEMIEIGKILKAKY